MIHLLLILLFLQYQQPEAGLVLEVDLQHPPTLQEQLQDQKGKGGILADLSLQTTILLYSTFMPCYTFEEKKQLLDKTTTSIAQHLNVLSRNGQNSPENLSWTLLNACLFLRATDSHQYMPGIGGTGGKPGWAGRSCAWEPSLPKPGHWEQQGTNAVRKATARDKAASPFKPFQQFWPRWKRVQIPLSLSWVRHQAQ